MTSRAFCPIHLFDRDECSEDCKPARAELKRVMNAYHQYWYDRRRGVKPVSPSQYERSYLRWLAG
jgi:hypothetical protein